MVPDTIPLRLRGSGTTAVIRELGLRVSVSIGRSGRGS